MKKFSTYLLVAMLSVLCFSACNDDEKGPSGPSKVNTVLVDGKSIKDGALIPLNNTAFKLSWVISRGGGEIRSINITANNQVVTDGKGIVWDGSSTGSQSVKGQREEWVETIQLALPVNSNMLGLYEYVITVNSASASTSFRFTIQYNKPAFPGEPAIAFKLNDQVGYDGMKYGIIPTENSTYSLYFNATQGGSIVPDVPPASLSSIAVGRLNDNGDDWEVKIYEKTYENFLDEYLDKIENDPNLTQAEKDTIHNRIKDSNNPKHFSPNWEEEIQFKNEPLSVPFDIGIYQIIVTDKNGLSKTVSFELTRKPTINDTFGLAGSEWELSNYAVKATIEAVIRDTAYVLSEPFRMPEDEAAFEAIEMMNPEATEVHTTKFERMNEIWSYTIEQATRKGRYTFTGDGKVITCTFDDNQNEKYIFTRNDNTLTRMVDVDIYNQMPEPSDVDPLDPNAGTLIYQRAKLTYTYTYKLMK